MKSLNDFARIRFALLPTPFYRLENISRELGKNIFIKRDDMTGVSLGGNKVRKLEFLLADAKAQGCDYVLTTGGAQSNHAMLTAACANRIGMKAILVLKKRGVCDMRGNQLLDKLLGADVRFVDSDSYEDVYAEMRRITAELARAGHKAYCVPVGGSVPLGSLGYIGCAQEIYAQADALGVHVDHIVCCTGSGGTHAGMAMGARMYGDARVTGIAVDDDPFERIVPELMRGVAALVEYDKPVSDDSVNLFSYYGAGYAIPSAEGAEAIRLMAHREGLILDPVYTGKTFAGLIDLNRKGYFADGDNIVFLHSGGAGGLFAIDLPD